MRSAHSYVKNVTYIFNILKTVKDSPSLYLASLDIELLYTCMNISFDMAIKVILEIFAGHPRLVLLDNKYRLTASFLGDTGYARSGSLCRPRA